MTKYIVDLKKLIKVGISPNEHLLLYLLVTRDVELTNRYIKTIGYFTNDSILKLERLGLLINKNVANDFKFDLFDVTETGKQLLELNKTDNFTTELLRVYPSTTPKGRKLRQASKKDVEILYNKCHENNKELHEKILKLLKLEVEDRTMRNSLDYMQNIKTWLRNRSYEAYEEDLNNNKSITIHGDKLF